MAFCKLRVGGCQSESNPCHDLNSILACVRSEVDHDLSEGIISKTTRNEIESAFKRPAVDQGLTKGSPKVQWNKVIKMKVKIQ